MRLTRRQYEIVKLLHDGYTCPQIAEILGISLATVRRHVRDIVAKLPRNPHIPALRNIRLHAPALLRAA